MAFGISRTMVLVMALLAFASWAVWLGGLAAMQSYCVAGTGFETNEIEANGCGKWYRWYWFLMAFELVLLLATFASLIGRSLAHSRLALLALLTSALTMFILAGNAILTGFYGNLITGRNKRAVQAAAAGAIMTAASNALLLCALGTTPEPVGEYTHAGGKYAGTATRETAPAGVTQQTTTHTHASGIQAV